MYEITAFDGNPLSREPAGLKIRLTKTFKLANQSMLEINQELKLLTEADLADFRAWFTYAGYPITA